MTSVRLDRLQPGESGVVEHVDTLSSPVRQRLLEMGLTRGSRVRVVRFAPMGDPIEIRVKGYRLSLRRLEAEAVIVKKDMR